MPYLQLETFFLYFLKRKTLFRGQKFMEMKSKLIYFVIINLIIVMSKKCSQFELSL